MRLTCACHNLRRASRIVTQLYDEHLEEVGLKATQYSALAALAWYRDKAPTIGELAEALVLDQSSLSRNLAVLERDRLLRLVPGDEDRRERRVVLTRAGRAALARGYPIWRRAQATLEAAFREGELDAQVRTVRVLAETARGIPSRSGSAR